MAGLKPNDFFWIIEGKLAVSECIGGGGLTARKIRREEEIQWLKSQGINSIFSLSFSIICKTDFIFCSTVIPLNIEDSWGK